MKAWSEIYCGITHYGSCDDHRRSSINIFNAKAQLVRWWRGCGFSPDTDGLTRWMKLRRLARLGQTGNEPSLMRLPPRAHWEAYEGEAQ